MKKFKSLIAIIMSGIILVSMSSPILAAEQMITNTNSIADAAAPSDATSTPSSGGASAPSSDASAPSSDASAPNSDTSTPPSSDASAPNSDASTPPSSDASAPSSDASTPPSSDTSTPPSSDASTPPSSDTSTPPSSDTSAPSDATSTPQDLPELEPLIVETTTDLTQWASKPIEFNVKVHLKQSIKRIEVITFKDTKVIYNSEIENAQPINDFEGIYTADLNSETTDGYKISFRVIASDNTEFIQERVVLIDSVVPLTPKMEQLGKTNMSRMGGNAQLVLKFSQNPMPVSGVHYLVSVNNGDYAPIIGDTYSVDTANTYSFVSENGASLRSAPIVYAGFVGWVENNNKKYYFYPNGEMAKGAVQIDGIWYGFSSAGVLSKGMLKYEGKIYFANDNGILQTKFQDINGARYYFDELTKAAVTGGMLAIGNYWYYFNAESQMVKDAIVVFSDGKRAFDAEGHMILGWAINAGKKYYTDPATGIAVAPGLRLINGAWFYINADCAVATNTIVEFSDGKRAFDEEGRMILGWVNSAGKKYYTDPATGIAVAPGLRLINGAWFYINADCAVATNAIVEFSDGKRAFDEEGRMMLGWVNSAGKKYYTDPATGIAVAPGLRLINGAWFYINADCAVATNAIVEFSDGKRAFDEEGRMILGWAINAGKKYYTDPSTGIAVSPGLHQIEGAWFFIDADCTVATSTVITFTDGKRAFDADGNMMLGWVNSAGKKYYTDPSTGIAVSPGLHQINGAWFFIDADCTVATSTVITFTDGKRAFDADGNMMLGWVNSAGKKYYTDPSTGIAVSPGLHQIEGAWFFIDADCTVATSTVITFTDGKRAFDADGRMILGWVNSAGKKYYTDPSTGIAVSPGLHQIEGAWFFIDADCTVATSKVITFTDGKRAFDAEGRMTFGWVQFEGKRYYIGSNGLAVKGNCTIDGFVYKFDENTCEYIGFTMAKCIDVSAHQGQINWKAVADDGIKFAVVKALGWSREKNYYVIDECFEYNVREAKRYGIKVGAYLFSYAYTDAQALEEADFFHNSEVMKRLRADGFKFDLPVFFDYEYTGSNGMGGIPANTSSNEQRTQILRTGMERLKSYGYYPGFYSGYNFTKRFLNGEQLIREGYDFWVADYRGSNAWGSSAVMWQYGGGSVNGIIGNVDMNELYKDYTGIIFGSGSGLPSVEISITVRDANNSNQIVTAPLTDILAQIVYNEIGNPKITGRDRDKAFRVQAIAAHSWLLYQQQNAGQDVAVAPIVGLKKNPPADIKQAVEAVKNSVLVYNGKPAMTMYSSSSGGVTNSAQDYFARSDFPYLTNVSANVGKWEEKAVSYGWEPYRNRSRTFNKTEMSQAIYKMGITPNSDLASWVSSVGKNPQSGYSTGVTVCGNWVKPATFYGNLYGLISPNFDFRYNGNETWTAYNINGNGHGVGMSQYALIGACGETEKTEIEILKTFYPNTELVIV